MSGKSNAINTNIPVSVSNGGTGASSFTAYTPICGGTTSTSALQSVASVGTAGQVLTSNGSSALPSFQNAPASPGIVIQTVQSVVTTQTTTRPLSAFAASGVSVSITPTNINSSVFIICYITAVTSEAGMALQLMRNSTPICLNTDATITNATIYNGYTTYSSGPYSIFYIDSPNTLSSLTYEIYFCSANNLGLAASDVTLNSMDASAPTQGTPSVIIAMELGS